jgi:transposase-like protein
MKTSDVNQNPTGRPPTKHSLELKVSVARKVIDEHKSQAALAQETGLSVTNIHKWVG